MGRADDGVRGDPVPGVEDQEVADDDVARLDVDPPAVAADRDARGQEGAQTLGGAVGPRVLDEGEDGVEEDDGHDRDPELRQAGDDGQARRDPQHERERVDELAPETPDRGGSARGGQGVRPVRRQAPSRLRGGEPGERHATHTS